MPIAAKEPNDLEATSEVVVSPKELVEEEAISFEGKVGDGLVEANDEFV